METLQPILKRGRDVWDQINMPKSELLQRLEKIREEMTKEGIEVLLLYGASVHGYGDVCYISNFATKLPAGTLVVVPRKGELTLFFEGSSRELKIGKRVTWIDDIRSSLAGVFSSSGSLAEDCVKYLQENHLIPSKVGFVGLRELMPYRELQRLIEGVKGCEIVEVDPILRNMRMIKSSRECDQIRRASRIVSNAFEMIPCMALGKMDERNMEAKIDWAVRVQGAEDVRILLARPKRQGWAMRPAEKTSLSSNDTVIVYLAASFERYWAEGIKTFVVKKPSFAEVNDEKVNELYKQITAGVKPGKPVSQFYQEAMDEFRRKNVRYIPDYGLGHGIGLSPEELPVMGDKDPNRFAEGMCLVLRIAIEDQERGAVMIGNTICLSETDTEVLTV
jgi:Xaa-Pro aminopeptidase